MSRSFKEAGLALVAALLLFSLVSPCCAALSWAPYQSPASIDLYAVSNPLANSSSMWAVGREGYVLRFDGTSWSTLPRPTDQSLRGVWQVSDSDVWVVGDAVDGVPTMLHWNGTWSPAIIQRGGEDGCTLPQQQLNATSPCGSLNAVMMVNATYGWAVGDAADGRSTILTFQDGMWRRDINGTGSTPPVNLYGLQVLPTGELWTAGESYSADNMTLATIGHRNVDGGWRNEAGNTSPALSHTIIRAVAIVGASVWAAGQDSNGTEAVIALFDPGSSTWNIQMVFHDSNPPVTFTGVSGVRAEDVWFVGTTFSGLNEPLLVHFDGTTMTRYSIPELINYPSGYQLNAVSMVSDRDGWAVGNDGLILRFGVPAGNETTITTATSSPETSITTTTTTSPTTPLNLPIQIVGPLVAVVIVVCALVFWLRMRRRNKAKNAETLSVPDASEKKDEAPRGGSEAHAVQQMGSPPSLPGAQEAEVKTPTDEREIKETTETRTVAPPSTEAKEPAPVKEEAVRQTPEAEKTEMESHNIEARAEKKDEKGITQAPQEVKDARQVEQEAQQMLAETDQAEEGVAPLSPKGEKLTAAERLRRFVDKSSTR